MKSPAFDRPAAARRLLLTVSILATGTLGAANVLVSSEGFESPDFAPGVIEGQQGWLTSGVGSSSATVQDTEALTGSQAVRVERTANSTRFWAQPIAGAPTGRFVSIDWDMMVPALTGSGLGFGPFIGVTANDDGIAGGGVAVAASLGVDMTTGDVLFQQEDTGFLLETSVDAVVGEWAHYRIEMDFQTDTYQAFVDDALVATTGFVDRGFGIDRLTDADIAVTPAAGDGISAGLEAVAFIDNFVVRDGLRADYSGNGVVDAADYTRWRDNENETGFFLTGDGDANAVVDADDYQLWADAFGDENSLSSTATSVPEPVAAFLAAIGMATMTTSRQR